MIETIPDTLAFLASVQSTDAGTHVVAQSTDTLGPLAAEVGTGGVMDWIKSNAVPLILLACGCVAGTAALRQNASKVITIGALLIVVLGIIGIASSPAQQETVMRWVLGLIGL